MEKDNKQTQSVNESNEILETLETEKLNMKKVESAEVEVNDQKPLESKDAPKNKKAKRAVLTTAIVLGFVGVLFLGLYLGGYFDKKPEEKPKNKFNLAGGEEYDPDDYKNVKMKPNIQVPGFESLTLKKNTTKQKVGFTNPKDNTVFFKMTLIMDSGKHKGETIWTSGNNVLKPGLAYNTINLKFPLAQGEYNAIMKYECYSVKDLSQQNGSEIGIRLEVK